MNIDQKTCLLRIYRKKQQNSKLAKATARYMEMEEFKDSDHHTGYFCYNCVYFMKSL